VSYRALPLTARGKLVGVLEAFHRSDVDVDQEWLGFLEALSTTAAIAVQSASLQHQVDRGGGTRRSTVERPELSRVEWRIMALVVEGSTNREIAGQVHLSENTIKFHIRRLLDRVGAVNRTDLARKATQNAWL
jgi:DNA-binding NarL/FixJ family response regulator